MSHTLFGARLMLIAAVFLTGCRSDAGTVASSMLERGFVAPPDSVKISTYWYWISGNVSKEGVAEDLRSMKAAGIDRAYIGNIGHDDVPYGPVELMSEPWWEILHTALKTATELDMEIGIFNSPGWSQSGGPWVKPEESMRYLCSSQVRVEGPSKFSGRLPKPEGMIQDVRVIAYLVPKNDGVLLNGASGTVRSVPALPGIGRLADGDTLTSVRLPVGKTAIVFESPELFTARSITVRPEHRPIVANAVLEALDGSDYRPVAEFDISRFNEMPNVGFDVYAPVTISFPATSSRAFRLSVDNAGGPAALREVELSAAARVERYSEKSLAKMHQTPLPYWEDYLWPAPAETDDPSLAVDPAAVRDITEFVSGDGMLTWDVPAGEWAILRTGMASTGVTNSPAAPEATGLEIDKMNREHVRTHFDAFIGKILERIPEADRRSFKVVVQDSYETGGQNFTDDFIARFEKCYGYDPVPFLPVFEGVVVGSAETSDRFLWDVRRMVADAVSYEYVGGMREVCHEHGLTTWLENYGHWGFPGEFLQYGGQSDDVAGEFWSEGELGDIENRAASSCAHIYGKSRVYAESFTCAGAAFSRYPANMKQRCDRFFAEGINSTLLTLFISQLDDGRLPGVNAAYGNEFNRNNTWYPQLNTFIEYLRRCNFMLQQGLNIADVAYFVGEDAPKMTGVADPALPAGYQFDYINGEVLRDRASVRDGLLTLPHGTQYRLLVLPELETMRPELLTKIARLVRDGAVVLGPCPDRSPSLQGQPGADLLVRALASEMWAEVDGVTRKSRRYGKGAVLSGMSMEEALAYVDCPPDLKTDCRDIVYGHRRVGETDIYFVANQSARPVAFEAGFRVRGLRPELWLPVSGAMRPLPEFTVSDRSVSVPLKLEPYESAFVVFREPAQASDASRGGVNYPEPVPVVEITAPWTVAFDAARRGPGESVTMDSLTDWALSDDDRIRFYSGTASYKNRFNWQAADPSRRLLLDLGCVAAMARVRLNGRDVGGVWTYPYRLDVTDFVKEGGNDLEIGVVNTWVNRLIGDSALPAGERPTWSPHNPWTPSSPLQTSGLLGPVRIESVCYQ